MVGIIVMLLMTYILFVFAVCDGLNTDGFEFVNPIWIYKRFKVNWFGTIFLMIVFNILALPFAIGYWFYKLCTVGRN